MTIVDWASFEAVLFDLDGVITPTASVHQIAWATLFHTWGFTEADYLAYIDGKARYDGVQAFLAARQVELPWGNPDDPPGDGSICALGNKKNALFGSILEREGVAPYPGTMRLLRHLAALGIESAVVSSSRNARAVLAAAGLAERFEIVVDGETAADHTLAGKPDPAMFLYAAELVGVSPAAAVVVEDARSGVAAGCAGGFGLVVGVDRGGNADALRSAGAEMVVTDVGDTLAPGEPV